MALVQFDVPVVFGSKIYKKTTGGIVPIETEGGGEENYSTDEQVIGTWIDGNPLCRKVFSITSGPQSEGDEVVLADLANLNIDKLVSLYGSYTMPSGSLITVNYVSFKNLDNPQQVLTYVSNSGGTKKLREWHRGSESFSNLPGLAILEYTKTTDQEA